jgi:hypothetical protein
MSQQSLIHVEVPLSGLALKKCLGNSIEFCAELAGYSYDKELEHAVEKAGYKKFAAGQLTRWKQGAEGVTWDRLTALMNVCGNDAPVLWMLQDRGYDLSSVRRMESTVERENRLLREENAALRRVLTNGDR